MKTTLQNYRRLLFARIAASVVSFGLFIALAVTWVVTHAESLRLTLLIPLIIAVFVLPRRMPDEWEGEEPTDEERDNLERTRKWLSYVRVIYFLVALFVMLVLPEVLN